MEHALPIMLWKNIFQVSLGDYLIFYIHNLSIEMVVNYCLFRNQTVNPALKGLALLLLKKSGQRNWRWLQVVPLFHFLTGLSVPYQTIPVKNEDIKWNFWIELELARKKQHSNSQRLCEYKHFVIITMNNIFVAIEKLW